jgi:hypothetical protein
MKTEKITNEKLSEILGGLNATAVGSPKEHISAGNKAKSVGQILWLKAGFAIVIEADEPVYVSGSKYDDCDGSYFGWQPQRAMIQPIAGDESVLKSARAAQIEIENKNLNKKLSV